MAQLAGLMERHGHVVIETETYLFIYLFYSREPLFAACKLGHKHLERIVRLCLTARLAVRSK